MSGGHIAQAIDARAAGWVRGWAPPPRLTVSEWADENRWLSAKASSEVGPWRTERTPYLREIMDCLSDASPIERVTFQKGAQVGGTECGLNWLGYIIDVAPGPVMMVQPTTDVAKRYSKQRITPMLEETPALREKVRENRSRDDSNTTLMKDFEGGVLVLAGANSAAGLRSMPVRHLFLDEVDGYPHDVDGEGAPAELARKRQAAFMRRKTFECSTPTTKGYSPIEAALERTDYRRYFVPCPHCEHYQVLRWANVRWPQGRPELAAYACEECGAEIEEQHKTKMLARGEWRVTKPDNASPLVRGYHLPSLYSPVGWASWAELAGEFIAAKLALDGGDASAMKVFVNTVLAETWEEAGEVVAGSALQQRAGDYALRTVPTGGLVLTAAVDVQADRLEVLVKAWGRGEESWVCDWQAFYGDPGAAAVWERLDEYLNAPIRQASGVDMRVMACAIDSGGHHTHHVYAFARSRAHRHVLAIKGQSQSGKPVLGKPTDVDVTYKGMRIKRGAKVWPIGVDTAKSLIYGRLRLTKAAESGPGVMHFSRDLPAEYYEQLTAERLVTRYHKGHPRLEWVKPNGRRNEALDCEVYAYAAAIYLGVSRWKNADWDRLERKVQPAQLDMLNASASAPAPDGPPDNPSASSAPAASVETGNPRVQTSAPPARARRTARQGFANNWRR
jgi:phage terminase large subunit GpA-like protein